MKRKKREEERKPQIVYFTCPNCHDYGHVELYMGNLDGQINGDGIIRQGKFWQEGFYIYHCKGKPVLEVR